MLSLERIPDQIGHLILTEDGAVLTVIFFFHIKGLLFSLLIIFLQNFKNLQIIYFILVWR